ncbi:non-hydrolyzing UDP-N-acetylglucosamine 2-epimerase [Vogesella indigofera]|uniref:non-hydrolyzing UDP-N-acetylglucosamine 2-epimerase n=1 Tax=Vogesella indigofera TaxID=45465 RepID=UPI0035B0EAEB
MNILTVVGARPQFIKAASVASSLSGISNLAEVIVHTDQHYDAAMSGVFLEELGIPAPDYNLGIRGWGAHVQNTGRMIERIEQVLLHEKPDWLLVYGDTDSTLAGAIAACKLDIPTMHIEVGLRSFNRKIPEEMNRILTDHASTHIFAPAQTAIYQLESEGISREDVAFSGDIMFDTAIHFDNIAAQKIQILSQLNLSRKEYVLATTHRKESTDDVDLLSAIIDGLSRLSCPAILSVAPSTKKKLDDSLIRVPSNVTVTEPVNYLDMIRLEQGAHVIATDSGGVQKEAFFHGVPCVTFRYGTEWTELVTIGANSLAGAYADKIHELIETTIEGAVPQVTLYGTGNASKLSASFFERLV